MPESPPQPESGEAAASAPDREPNAGMPRWVKVSAIVALVLVVLVVAMLIAGGPGDHGPGRH